MIGDLIPRLIKHSYNSFTNLGLIIQLLSQIVIRLGLSLGFQSYTELVDSITGVASNSKNDDTVRQ